MTEYEWLAKDLHAFADRNNGLNWPGRIHEAAEAIEKLEIMVAESEDWWRERAEKAEAELAEAHAAVKDLTLRVLTVATRAEKVEAELAAERLEHTMTSDMLAIARADEPALIKAEAKLELETRARRRLELEVRRMRRERDAYSRVLAEIEPLLNEHYIAPDGMPAYRVKDDKPIRELLASISRVPSMEGSENDAD